MSELCVGLSELDLYARAHVAWSLADVALWPFVYSLNIAKLFITCTFDVIYDAIT